MAICKGLLVVIVSLQVVIWTNLIGESEGANYIQYGSLGRDIIPGCGPKHPEECRRIPANAYTRGCLSEERCRDHYREPEHDFDGQDDEMAGQIGHDNDTSISKATDVKYHIQPQPLGGN